MDRNKHINLLNNTSLTFFILLLFFVSINTKAQKKWDGEAGDNNWHTAANWDGDALPDASDVVVLDNSEFGSDYTINISTDIVNVKKIKINATAANIRLNVGQNVTITEGEFSLRSNAGHTATLDVNANITVSGGSEGIPNFGTVPSDGDKVINANSGIIQVNRDIKFDPNTAYTSGTETWRFEGNVNSTIQTGNTTTIHKLELDKSNASHTLTIDSDLAINSDLKIQKGNIDVKDDLKVSGNTLIESQGVLKDGTSTGDLLFIGDVTVNGVLKSVGDSQITFRSDLTNNSSGEVNLDSPVLFTTNAKTITNNNTSKNILFKRPVQIQINTTWAGNAKIIFENTLTIASGITVTNNNTERVHLKSSLSAAGATITNGITAGLELETNMISLGTLDAYTHDNNKVIYSHNSNQPIIAADYQNLILSNGATKSLTGNILVNDLFINASTTLDVTNNNYQLTMRDDLKNDGNFEARNGTVLFEGNLSQKIEGAVATTFYNLTVNKSGNELELEQNIEVENNFVHTAGVFDLENKSFVVGGSSTIQGELKKTSFGGDTSFEDAVTIGSTGKFESTVNSIINFENGLTNAGTLQLKSALFSENPQTYFPQFGSSNNIETLEIDEDIIIADGTAVQVTDANLNETLSNQNTTGLTFMNNPTGAGTIINGANAILIYRGASDFFITGTVDFTDLGNKVIYNRNGSQNILTTTYHHLELKGSGAIDSKQLSGHSTVNGDLTVGANVRLDTQTFNLFIGGNFTNNGDFTSTFGEVTFNGTSPQTINGSSTTSFKGLIINSSGNVNLQTSSEANYINLTSGHLRLNDNDLKLNNTTAVFGGSTSSYIITNGSGQVTRPLSVTSSPCLFPVGNGGYTPIILSTTNASATNVAIGSENTFLNKPATVTDHINRTWTIVPDVDVNNIDIEFNWVGADIIGTLAISDVEAYRYDGGQWIASGQNGLDLTNRELSLSNVLLETAVFTEYAISSTPIGATQPNPTTVLFANPITSNSFQANWEKVVGAISYDVEVSFESDFSNLLVNDNTTDTLYSVTGLSPNDILYVRVKSINSAGSSDYSSVLTVIVTDPLPIIPQNYNATIVDKQNANLRWDDESFNETGFIVERAINFDDFVVIDTVYSENNTGEVLFIEEDLSFNRTYFYRVKAFNEFGESAPTEAIGLVPGSNVITGTEDLLNSSNTLHIYPNPSNGVFFIDYVSQSSMLPITIWSLDGQMMWQQELIYNPNQLSLNLNHLVAGTYLVVIQDKEETINQRIVIVD